MKLSLLTLISFTCLVVNAQMPTNGLVAYFPFNSNAKDSSASMTHGTAYNVHLTSDRFGNEYSAYLFSGEYDSYIEFPSTYVQTNTYTYAMWALVNTIPSDGDYRIPLNIGSTAGDQSITIANNAYGTYNGWLGGGYHTSGTPTNNVVNENKSISTRAWTHILYVRDSTHFLLYINGILIDSIGFSTVKYPYYGSSTVRANIGRRNDGSRPFIGKLDDVCIYNRALSRSEIAALYDEQNTSVYGITCCNPGIRVYPNINTANFNIDLSSLGSASKNITVRITNTLGQLVYEQVFPESGDILQIESNLGNGQYFVTLYGEQNLFLAAERILVGR